MIFSGAVNTDRTALYGIYIGNSGATLVENNTVGGTVSGSISSNMAGQRERCRNMEQWGMPPIRSVVTPSRI